MASEKRLDLIDRQAVVDDISKIGVVSVGTVLGCLSDAKRVDAVEVVHGRWEDVKETSLYVPDMKYTVTHTAETCSACKVRIGFIGSKLYLYDNICPNCGADMRDGDGDKGELIRALQYDRNQYREGYNNGYRDGKERAMEDIAFPRFLVRPSETSKGELEAILHSPVTIITNKESITPIYPYGRWIPVTERLPEDGEEALCLTKWGRRWVAVWNEMGDHLWTDGEGWISNSSVTHWMPLPEPPKEV